ncbi:unnamed protein product [Paramecium sonneborni]|uniref:Transmembrane protein n=1 Tax=Paramecium sonneborni TaxID=65129 RepID=A0A8S1Q9S4_9CILI|nr:unnamed protein product [Paramecium sonneborni]
MYLFTTILIFCTCSKQHYKKQQDFYIYPTQGEYIDIQLAVYDKEQIWNENYIKRFPTFIEQEIFLLHQSNMKYFYHPQVPFITINNAVEKISSLQGINFKSLSSNESHFLTISTDDQIQLYEWKNQLMSLIEPSINIEDLGLCYTATFSFEPNYYIVDCYENNQLNILQFGDQMNLIYQNPTVFLMLPIKTNFKLYQIGDQNYIIYVQYFQNYSILTLFSKEFQNLTYWIDQFIDFDVANQGSKLIYVLTTQSLIQLQISQDIQFVDLTTYLDNNMYDQYQSFSIYYNYQYQASCDQIIIKQENYISQFQGYVGEIVLVISTSYTFTPNPFNYFIFNQYFMLYQVDKSIIIQGIQQNLYSTLNLPSNTTLLYYNIFTNELFSFDSIIQVYQISNPKLMINLTNVVKLNQKITIFSQQQQNKSRFQIEFSLTINLLDKNDTNIYKTLSNEYFLKFQKKHLFYNLSQSQQYIFQITGFQGELLNYTVNQNDPTLGIFQNITFMKICEFNTKNFDLLQIVNKNISFYYIIGYKDQTLEFYLCQQQNLLPNTECQNLSSFQTSPNVISLQYGLSAQYTLVAGLSYQNSISLFQLNLNQNISQYDLQIKQDFSDFILIYNSVIVLIKNKEIQINSFDQSIQKTINQNTISNLFQNYSNLTFNPIQIATYSQLISSVIFINNFYNVLIIEVNLQFSIIPLSYINIQNQIFGINIVNYQIIISYICNYQNSICFQVWNIQNFIKPFYVKSLQRVPYDNSIQLQSDNLFFYVSSLSFGTLIYTPNLFEKMSLYKNLQFSSFLSSMSNLQRSLIFKGNKLYQLLFFETYSFSFNKSLNSSYFNNTFPRLIFNFSVTTPLNVSAQQFTPNESFIYYSNFTQIQNFSNITLNQSVCNNYINKTSKQLSIPLNLLVNQQILNCSTPNDSKILNKCKLTDTNWITFLDNYTFFNLINVVNDQYYAIQNYQSIVIYNINLDYIWTLNYSNQSFTNCIISTSQYNSLYSICQKDAQKQYLVNFIFNDLGHILQMIVQPLEMYFQSIQKYTRIFNYNFILANQNDQDYQNYDFTLLVGPQSFGKCVIDYDTLFLGNTSFQDQLVSKIAIILITNYPPDYYTTLNYMILMINQTKIIFGDQHLYDVEIRPVQSKIQLNFTQIQVLQQFFLQSLIQCISNNMSVIFYLTYNYPNQIQEGEGSQFTINNINAIIPQYGYLQLSTKTAYSNGILMQIYSQSNLLFTASFYNISQINYVDDITPILMFQGQSNLNSIQQVMMIKKLEQQNEQLGTFLSFYYNKIILYPINKQYLNCDIKKHGQTIQTNISCKNQYYTGTFQITLEVPSLQYKKQHWMIALLLIILVLLILFYFLVRYRLRNMKNLYTEIEL